MDKEQTIKFLMVSDGICSSEYLLREAYEAGRKAGLEDAQAKVAALRPQGRWQDWSNGEVAKDSLADEIYEALGKLRGCRTEQPAPKCEECDIEMDLVGTIDRHDGQTWHCSQCGWSWP